MTSLDLGAAGRQRLCAQGHRPVRWVDALASVRGNEALVVRTRSHGGGVHRPAHDGHLGPGRIQGPARPRRLRCRRLPGHHLRRVIDATRIWTGEPERDAHLRSADFFDVENHPEITFAGRFTERVGDSNFKALAGLTIRGATNEVPLDVAYLGQWTTPYWEGDENKGEMTRIGFSIAGRVNRHDFGVSWNDRLPRGGVVVSHEVGIQIDVETIRDDDLRAVGLEGAVYSGSSAARQ
jgi:hypothetical protein